MLPHFRAVASWFLHIMPNSHKQFKTDRYITIYIELLPNFIPSNLSKHLTNRLWLCDFGRYVGIDSFSVRTTIAVVNESFVWEDCRKFPATQPRFPHLKQTGNFVTHQLSGCECISEILKATYRYEVAKGFSFRAMHVPTMSHRLVDNLRVRLATLYVCVSMFAAKFQFVCFGIASSNAWILF